MSEPVPPKQPVSLNTGEMAKNKVEFQFTELILVNSQDEILDALDRLFDTGAKAEIKEGRRIQFFEGKRKLKDGTLKKTGHLYWEWSYKDPDTGKRKRPYGGAIKTVPNLYQYRREQYEARITSRSPESLADTLFRPQIARLQNNDSSTKKPIVPSS